MPLAFKRVRYETAVLGLLQERARLLHVDARGNLERGARDGARELRDAADVVEQGLGSALERRPFELRRPDTHVPRVSSRRIPPACRCARYR